MQPPRKRLGIIHFKGLMTKLLEILEKIVAEI
jgi:hypothetical protein